MRSHTMMSAVAVLVMGLSTVVESAAIAQQMGGQQPMMQRMSRIIDWSHQMSIRMALQGGPMAGQQQMMQRMGESMGAMAEHMKAMMTHAQGRRSGLERWAWLR